MAKTQKNACRKALKYPYTFVNKFHAMKRFTRSDWLRAKMETKALIGRERNSPLFPLCVYLNFSFPSPPPPTLQNGHE
jgi:hypothetical protein